MQLWVAPWVQPGAEPWELPPAEPQAEPQAGPQAEPQVGPQAEPQAEPQPAAVEPLASTLSAHAQAFTPAQGQDTMPAAPTKGPIGGEDPTTARAAVLAPDAAAADKPRMAPLAELPLPSRTIVMDYG